VTFVPVQLRRVARFAYGDSLADALRSDGPVPVFGSNGPVGTHVVANTTAPVIVVGRKGSFGKVQFSDHPVFAIDTTFYVDETCTDADIRWLYYALQSLRLDELSEDVGVPGLSREKAYEQRLLVPPVDKQRAIADYLDRETARVDALIAAKQRMVKLLEVRFWSAFTQRVFDASARQTQLRRVLTSLIDGPFGSAFSSSDYVDEGPAVVRLGNIGFAEYRHADQAHIPLELFERFRAYQVLKGDLLIAGLGDDKNHAGRACVAPDLGDGMVKGKCFRGRVDLGRCSTEFLALLLSSPLGATAMGVSGRGSTRSMINLEVVKSTEVPLPTRETQEAIVDQAAVLRTATETAIAVIQQQLGLLSERRRALITTAVTRQLRIPTPA